MPNPPRQPISPKVLGFEIYRILDLHLKPQSSPSVLSWKAETLHADSLLTLTKRLNCWDFSYLVWGWQSSPSVLSWKAETLHTDCLLTLTKRLYCWNFSYLVWGWQMRDYCHGWFILTFKIAKIFNKHPLYIVACFINSESDKKQTHLVKRI